MIEHLLGLSLDRETCRRYLGDMDQVSFAREFVLSSGPGTGVRGVDVCTGSGLRFTTLPGRGMDISDMTYRGIPIHYSSATAITNAARFEEPGYGMMRSFFGGLLTTCGISNAGWPSEDEGKSFGLHGRISNTEAEHIAIDARWTDDDYKILVRGRMREAAFRGENLRLEREIQAGLRSPEVIIRDTVENRGYRAEPLMLIYHINLGFPLVSPHSRIIAPVMRTIGYDEETNRPEVLSRWYGFDRPQDEPCRRLFLHDISTDAAGGTFFAVVNESLAPAGILGLEVRYSAELMPYLTQFTVCEAGSYICCLEPGTVSVHGRGPLRRDNKVPLLRPDERRQFSMRFRVLTSNQDIEALRTESDRLTAAQEPKG